MADHETEQKSRLSPQEQQDLKIKCLELATQANNLNMDAFSTAKAFYTWLRE